MMTMTMTMTMTKTTVQLGGKACILLQSTCTAIYRVWNSRFDRINNTLVLEKNFEKIIFVVEVKSMKTTKFIVI